MEDAGRNGGSSLDLKGYRSNDFLNGGFCFFICRVAASEARLDGLPSHFRPLLVHREQDGICGLLVSNGLDGLTVSTNWYRLTILSHFVFAFAHIVQAIALR